MSATASPVAPMSHESSSSSSSGVVAAIATIVVGYAIALSLGLPQYGTQLVVDHLHHDSHADEAHPEITHEGEAPHPKSDSETSHPTGDSAGSHAGHAPPFWTVIPFVLLLGSIAVFPLVPAIEHWWEDNTNRFKVAASLGFLTLLYYLFVHAQPVEGHWPYHYVAQPNAGGANWDFAGAILGNALISEFIPFIVLLFSLFTISGGIRISGDLRATPMTNASFMAVGGLLASFIGTTRCGHAADSPAARNQS